MWWYRDKLWEYVYLADINVPIFKHRCAARACVAQALHVKSSCRSWCQYYSQLPQNIPAIEYVVSCQKSIIISTEKLLAMRIPTWSFADSSTAVPNQAPAFTGGFGPPGMKNVSMEDGSSQRAQIEQLLAEKHVETIIEANWDCLVDCDSCITISVPSPLTVHMTFFIGFKKRVPVGFSWRFQAFCRFSEATSDLHFRPGSDWFIS